MTIETTKTNVSLSSQNNNKRSFDSLAKNNKLSFESALKKTFSVSLIH